MENDIEAPASQQKEASPTAWPDDDVISNKSQGGSRPYTTTPVISVDKIDVDKESVKGVPEEQKDKGLSCFETFKNGVKSIWATRHTLGPADDKKIHVNTTVKELVVYLLFLILLSIVAFGMTNTSMFFVTKVMSELYLDSSSGGVSFRSIGGADDVWKFLRGPLPSALHWETWYNNQPLPDNGEGYIFHENKLLGLPRIRQVKVRNDSCAVHKYFRDVIFECYDAYSESNEDKSSETNDTRIKTYTAFTYHSEASLRGSSYGGELATYNGGGYVQNLGKTKTETQATLDYLFTERWITRGTRAFFIDFSVYNANVNLFCVIRLIVEFPATGGAIPSWSFRTVKLLRYVTVFDHFVMACEFFFALFIVYYIIEEIIEIKIHKLAYFRSVWNILDVTVIVISIVFLAFDIYRTLEVDKKMEKLTYTSNHFEDFDFLSLWQVRFDNAIAITVFLAWVKLFKYVSFNKTMNQLSSTLARCAKDLMGFAVMYFIVFLAFTQLGYLLFGSKLKEFSEFGSSFFALFNIILGSFDFYALRAVDRYLGPTFFFLFIFFIFFILVNMFLAIINDTYSEVKSELANQQDDFQISEYFLSKYRKMLGKIHAKEDRVLDLDDVLKYADANDDGKIDFEEWRQDLLKRGYAECEIEALFCKYDADGSRYLDKEEQERLRQDLDAQKKQINKEYNDLEDKNGTQVSENDDSDKEEDSGSTQKRGGFSGVLYEEYTHLCKRVERMEFTIGGVIGRIDSVLSRLVNIEKAKLKRRDAISKILNYMNESQNNEDGLNKEKMQTMIKRELSKLDSDDTDSAPSVSTRESSNIIPNDNTDENKMAQNVPTN
ncbi:polycystin-2-like protein 1 [Saccostrea cucullata]|uniref:polycystin-2-like protein 1 n=1 Tax=Saccostrea cuccullata TaxID=36930 RepID=UPI002ECFC5D4